MNILISRLSALGDTVCSLPAAVALKQQFPDCHITWAVDPRFAGIVECCDSVDAVFRSKPGFKPATWPTFDRPFDVALDLQGLLKSGLVVARAKAKYKLGYHWQREGAHLFSQKVLPDPSSIHIVDQYVDVARAAIEILDGDPTSIHRAHFGLMPREEDLTRVRQLLTEVGVTEAFVVLNAGAGWATKRWPASHFATLADLLAEKRVQTVLVGGKAPADIEAAGQVIEAATQKPISLLGKTSVRELVALVSIANAHVGGDTGSTHIAAALGVPAIGLYSITKPQRSCPYGQIHRCHYEPAGLAEISAIDVFGTVYKAIQ